MLGHRLAVLLEDEAPRQGGLGAVNLAVEQVAHADECPAEGHDDDQPVEEPPGVHAVLLPIEPHGDEDGDGGAMAGQALKACETAVLERPEYLGPVLGSEEIVEIIEQAMSQTGTYEHRQEHIDHHAVEVVAIDLLVLEYPREDEVAQHKSAEESQRIPPQPETPDVEQHGIDIPMDGVQYHYLA